MWHQAKLKFRQMVYDDSGIAMAYTIVVFLVFFMICVGTYAMSENIRQKMEMQNACDAAAYSGAVVQADMLARIAVLNRALSWTYFETNKRHMDYVVDIWIDATIKQWDKDFKYVYDFNDRSCHAFPPKWPFTCYFATSTGMFGLPIFRLREQDETADEYIKAKKDYYKDNLEGFAKSQLIKFSGVDYESDESKEVANNFVSTKGGSQGYNWTVNLNASQDVTVNFLRKNWQNMSATRAREIDNANNVMRIIQQEAAFLRRNINAYEVNAANTVLNSQLPAGGNAYVILGDDAIRFNDSNAANHSTASYFRDMNDESKLFAYTHRTSASLLNGHDRWWATVPGKIQRNCLGGLLFATYNCFSSYWEDEKIYPSCIPIDYIEYYVRVIIPDQSKSPHPINISDSGHGNQIVANKDLLGDAKYLTSMQVAGTELSSSFFGKAGTIVVAAQTNAANPLSILFGSAGIYTESLYFGQTMTAVSAARAGIRLQGMGDAEYSVFYPGETVSAGYTDGVWNLCEDDWDAVMLPLKRAWCSAPENAGGKFSKYANENGTEIEYSSDAILKEVYSQFERNGSEPQGTDDFMWH